MIMKRMMLLLIFGMAAWSSHSQTISATLPARLQVYGMKTDGTQVVMTSEQLLVLYDQLKMNGELRLASLQTDDQLLRNLLDSAASDRITFSGAIPEGSFMFHDALNEQFTVESEIIYNDLPSRIILNFDVSNRKTSLANTFDITVTGSLSLKDDLGLTRDIGLDDKVSFQFFQNIQAKSY
jgi:hypothetical protein